MTVQPSYSRGRVLRTGIAVAVASMLTALIVWGFVAGRKEAAMEAQRERPVKAPLRVSSQNGTSVVTLDAKTQERSGIKTDAPEPASYADQVRAYASVVDLARLTDLANSYANARAQLDAAQAKLAASRTAFERVQTLYQDQQNMSLAQLQAAQATLRSDQAGVAAAESQVRTLAATAQQEWGAGLGKSLIDRSPLVTRLIQRQDFLVQVTLPPGIALPKPPATAAIQTGEGTRAAIRYLSPATRTDPKVQGISFLYVAPASSGVLPGMNVLAFLPSGKPGEGVSVPAAAIVWWQGRAWVYRRAGGNSFTRTAIATDRPAPGGGFVVKDLPNNAQIVTSGAQLLLSEEFRAQIQVGEDRK